ncbi:MAG: leucyl aminopeptidase [Gemmatimonadota bacterium]
MEIAVLRTDCTEHATALLAVTVFEGADPQDGPAGRLDERLRAQVSEIVARGDFKGKPGETLLVYPRDGSAPPERLLLVGAGKPEGLDAEVLRRAAATAVKQVARLGIERFATVMHDVGGGSNRLEPSDAARAVAEGLVLGSYVFDQFKTKPDDETAPAKLSGVELLEKVEEQATQLESGIRIGGALGRGENLARTLGNLPGNVATPTYLADEASRIASDFGMQATIFGPAELEAESMGAILAVSQGSEQEPRLIVLEHRKGPEDARPIALVGKGLTFDTGGISIKPAQGMEEMKFDMCGGAAVLGAMQAIGELDLPINVVAVVPSSENLPSGKALKPGDIIRSHFGKTIEIINTDAEGRLILADALSYVRRFEPLAVVDAATLTGSCVIALGHQASALLGNDDALIEELRTAGDRVGERAWPLPMFDEYREQIKSEYADIKNSGGRPAGSITAAWFLREFVGDMTWAHLDIAGTAYGEGKLAYQSKGATGAPTRLFVEWVLGRAA